MSINVACKCMKVVIIVRRMLKSANVQERVLKLQKQVLFVSVLMCLFAQLNDLFCFPQEQ